MNDRELIAMAAFRMREVAKRLSSLAPHADSPALRLWLTNTAQQLEAQARRATEIVAAADENDIVTNRAVA